MRGIDHLVWQRKRGITPSLVMVDLDPSPRAFCRLCDPEPGERPRQVPTVFVDPDQSIARLDLRPLIGLKVFAFGADGARLDAFRAAALEHEAGRVITYCPTTDAWTDTAGVHTGA
jgi:hypothetical protein